LSVRFRALTAGLLLVSVGVFAQEAGEPPRAIALIVPRPQGGERDTPFLRLFADALQIELAKAGLETRMPGASALQALAAAPLRRLLEEAADADFLVLESYTSTDQTMRLEVEVFRVQDGERLAAASTSRRIDLRVDEAVDEAVEQLLPQLRPHVAEAVRARERAAEALAAVATTPAETAPPAAEPPVAEPLGEPESPAAAGASPQPLPAGEPAGEPAAKPQRPRALEIGVGGGMFFPMAELSPLFRFGYLGEVYLEYRVRGTGTALAFGLYTGYAGLLPAEGGTASFFDSLVPIGVGLRVGTPARSRLGVHARLQAGGVLNVSSQTKVDQRLTRVLPQVKAGAGLSVNITPWLGVSVEFLYELLVYMYMDGGALAAEPIMGFNAPALFIYTRW
jgi:hypothetical protein